MWLYISSPALFVTVVIPMIVYLFFIAGFPLLYGWGMTSPTPLSQTHTHQYNQYDFSTYIITVVNSTFTNITALHFGCNCGGGVSYISTPNYLSFTINRCFFCYCTWIFIIFTSSFTEPALRVTGSLKEMGFLLVIFSALTLLLVVNKCYLLSECASEVCMWKSHTDCIGACVFVKEKFVNNTSSCGQIVRSTKRMIYQQMECV